MLRTTTLLGLLLTGCGGATDTQLRSQAADEFHCAESQIRVENEGPDVKRVSGCGQSVLYQCRGDARPEPEGPSRNLMLEEQARYTGNDNCHRLRAPKDSGQ
jgi:hypothetical protein